MKRRAKTRISTVVAVVCVLGLYPIGTAIANRAVPSVTSTDMRAGIKPAGVQADVVVTLRDNTFVVAPPRLHSGMSTLYVINKGQAPRYLTITGPGLGTKGRQTVKLAHGKSTTLKVRLTPGLYKLGGNAGKRTFSIEVKPMSLAPSDNGSDVQPPDGWWNLCEGI